MTYKTTSKISFFIDRLVPKGRSKLSYCGRSSRETKNQKSKIKNDVFVFVFELLVPIGAENMGKSRPPFFIFLLPIGAQKSKADSEYPSNHRNLNSNSSVYTSNHRNLDSNS